MNEVNDENRADGRPGSPRNVLVTGGAGFIGSHVVDGFLSRGDRVWVVDDLSTGRRENVSEGATLVEMSIDSPKLGALFEEVGFDLVSHHAAQIDVRVSVDDPARDARINVLGLLNVLEACRKHRVRRVVYVSSGGVVYGEPEERPTPESAAKLPLSPYGVGKLAGEFYLHYYHRIHGLEYIALRYSNVYGPRQDPHGEAGVVAIFSTRLLRGEQLGIFGDGEQTRDYVFVADVVGANLAASDMRLPEGNDLDHLAFNVGTGVETTVNELAFTLGRISGGVSEPSHLPPRPGELRHSCLDTSRLRATGWTAEVGIEDGLERTYRWIADRSAHSEEVAR